MLKPRFSLQDSGLFLTFAPGYMTMVDHPQGRASDASSKNSRHFFYALIIAKPAAFPKEELPSGESSSCNQREAQPFFFCAPGYEERGMLQDDALCRLPFISGRFSPQLFP